MNEQIEMMLTQIDLIHPTLNDTETDAVFSACLAKVAPRKAKRRAVVWILAAAMTLLAACTAVGVAQYFTPLIKDDSAIKIADQYGVTYQNQSITADGHTIDFKAAIRDSSATYLVFDVTAKSKKEATAWLQYGKKNYNAVTATLLSGGDIIYPSSGRLGCHYMDADAAQWSREIWPNDRFVYPLSVLEECTQEVQKGVYRYIAFFKAESAQDNLRVWVRNSENTQAQSLDLALPDKTSPLAYALDVPIELPTTQLAYGEGADFSAVKLFTLEKAEISPLSCDLFLRSDTPVSAKKPTFYIRQEEASIPCAFIAKDGTRYAAILGSQHTENGLYIARISAFHLIDPTLINALELNGQTIPLQ